MATPLLVTGGVPERDLRITPLRSLHLSPANRWRALLGASRAVLLLVSRSRVGLPHILVEPGDGIQAQRLHGSRVGHSRFGM